MFKERLNELKRKSLYRKFRTITSSSKNIVEFNNKRMIMLASNNYFGLNTHPKVVSAAKKAIDKYGTGNGASRLVANLDIHEKLEKEIARYNKCQSSLVYSSGYAANLGMISSIVGKNDIILSDELNHASIIDGCRLSRAGINVYNHCDVHDLKSKLLKIKNKRTLVVTDSIFSMDGDLAPLREIIELKEEYDFVLMSDEAHSLGILNTNFKGIDIRMGTFSKTLSSQGGYAAGSKEFIEYLKNTSRSFMYSTGLTPADSASALAALEIIKSDRSLKKNLLGNASYLRNKLSKSGFNTLGEYQIIPILTYDNKKTMQFQKLLEEDGIFVAGIRQPSVKIPRLRVCVMSSHTKNQLETAASSFRRHGEDLGLIPRGRK